MSSFNYGNNLSLGGLMGATPYSNVQILDSFTFQQHQHHTQQRMMIQQYQQQQRRGDNRKSTPTAFVGVAGMSSQIITSTPPVIKFRLPDHVIQDVLCRFIMNIPEEEKFDPVRALFQVELAHWFFIDHYCMGEESDPALANLGHIPFQQFAYIIFKEAPHLRQYYSDIDQYLADFRSYRSRVPTYGAILMNENLTRVVLVQGFRNQWGFPKGKVNENEDPIECAIREVMEETGYNMRPLINPDHFIESKAQGRNDRLYLVRGVDLQFPFYPQTQYEIKQILWFNIDEIPEHKRDTNPKIVNHGQSISNFFTVYPYVKRMKLWITDKLEGRNRIQCFRSKYFNQEEEENLSLEETYALQSQYTINTPSDTYKLTSLSKSSLTTLHRKNNISTDGDELIRVLGGMRITPVLQDQSFHHSHNTGSQQQQRSSSCTTVGGETTSSTKKNKELLKGAKSKKRLFTEKSTNNESINNAQQDAANFLSSAMGIPININRNNSQSSIPKNSDNPLMTTSTPINNNVFYGNLPSTTSILAAQIKINSNNDKSLYKSYRDKHDYTNFSLTAKSWENFKLDKKKLMLALQINVDPPP